jgi:Uma2 family endonuclease
MIKTAFSELRFEMTLSVNSLSSNEVFYPDGDGLPMAESDPTRDYLVYSVEALGLYFQNRLDVYVSGNLFIYYKQGVPDAVFAPDVFVVFGVEKKKRKSYKVWQEGNHLPAFILEITSQSTQENDEQDKPQKYQKLGVQEYFQYDPTGDYLSPQLKGARLAGNRYQRISPMHQSDGSLSLFSETLGLELRLTDGELRFFDPQTGKKLLSHAETEQARQQAEQARQQAEQARRDSIPRLLSLGLTVAQVAEALSLSIEEVQAFTADL